VPIGCDISEHQASFPDGAWDFVIIRLGTGEHGGRPDNRWREHYGEARARGIPVGAYWFSDPRATDPLDQAAQFLNEYSTAQWDLIPWNDLEVGNITREWEDIFNGRVQAAVGACGTYASDSVFLNPLRGSPWPRWVAAYPGPPRSPWLIHQYRGSPLDLDNAPALDLVRLKNKRPQGPTGADLLSCAYPFRGYPYSTAPGRTDPAIPWADCSGLICKAWAVLRRRFPQLPEMTATVSTTIERWAINNGGRYITREESLHTPACCVAVYGLGNKGHITFGVGDGQQEFGTPSDEGHQAGFSAYTETHQRNHYDRWFTLPGIDHLGTPEKEDQDVYTIWIVAVGPRQGWLLESAHTLCWITGDSLKFWRDARDYFGVEMNEFTIDKDEVWAANLVAQAPRQI
jgi:hypothetical protein